MNSGGLDGGVGDDDGDDPPYRDLCNNITKSMIRPKGTSSKLPEMKVGVYFLVAMHQKFFGHHRFPEHAINDLKKSYSVKKDCITPKPDLSTEQRAMWEYLQICTPPTTNLIGLSKLNVMCGLAEKSKVLPRLAIIINAIVEDQTLLLSILRPTALEIFQMVEKLSATSGGRCPPSLSHERALEIVRFTRADLESVLLNSNGEVHFWKLFEHFFGVKRCEDAKHAWETEHAFHGTAESNLPRTQDRQNSPAASQFDGEGEPHANDDEQWVDASRAKRKNEDGSRRSADSKRLRAQNEQNTLRPSLSSGASPQTFNETDDKNLWRGLENVLSLSGSAVLCESMISHRGAADPMFNQTDEKGRVLEVPRVRAQKPKSSFRHSPMCPVASPVDFNEAGDEKLEQEIMSLSFLSSKPDSPSGSWNPASRCGSPDHASAFTKFTSRDNKNPSPSPQLDSPSISPMPSPTELSHSRFSSRSPSPSWASQLLQRPKYSPESCVPYSAKPFRSSTSFPQ